MSYKYFIIVIHTKQINLLETKHVDWATIFNRTFYFTGNWHVKQNDTYKSGTILLFWVELILTDININWKQQSPEPIGKTIA